MKKKIDIEELPGRENNRIKREVPFKWRGWEKFCVRTQFTKAARWVHSFKGRTYDELLSEWVKQEWIHPQERTKATLDKSFIEANTVLNEKGVVCTLNEWSGLYEPVSTSKYRTLAVHPETKILFETKKTGKKKYDYYSAVRYLNVFLGPYHQLFKYKGVWYEVVFKKTYQMFDVYKTNGSYYIMKEQPPQEYLNDSKFERYKNCGQFEKVRQISKKEIKKYNLRDNEQ